MKTWHDWQVIYTRSRECSPLRKQLCYRSACSGSHLPLKGEKVKPLTRYKPCTLPTSHPRARSGSQHLVVWGNTAAIKVNDLHDLTRDAVRLRAFRPHRYQR
jgi:hypothetical protein